MRLILAMVCVIEAVDKKEYTRTVIYTVHDARGTFILHP